MMLSIDVEASGPFPGLHSLCSIGAVPVVERDGRFVVDETRTFYVELAPLPGAADVPEAMAVHGLTRAHLEANGLDPHDAMSKLAAYLKTLGGVRTASWPSSFDHPYVGWYAQRFLGRNPIGHSGFDIASFAMGLFRTTDRRVLAEAMREAGYRAPHNPHPHHALHDAIEQGKTLAWLLGHARASSS
ncbi:MAG: hypothetical protein IT379_24120 [Deltaproteobacteria bacterium]|nr:hypothetical protein [Deltaproteobacteria bacterium]